MIQSVGNMGLGSQMAEIALIKSEMHIASFNTNDESRNRIKQIQ